MEYRTLGRSGCSVSALALGGTRPLPELFAAAGIAFDFSERTLGPLMNALGEELSDLPD